VGTRLQAGHPAVLWQTLFVADFKIFVNLMLEKSDEWE
jgi:hypothetical protein